MKYRALVSALLLAGMAATPALADDHAEPAALPTEAQMREQAEEAKRQGQNMKQAGKEKGQQMKQMGKDKAEAAKASARQGRDDVVSGEKGAAEATGDVAEDVKQSGEEIRDEARKVPPGMEKRDQHPSTGKGSEQGQQSRNAEEKPWWRFWGE